MFEKNGLCDGFYAEPYAGGAAVGLSLLFLEYATRIYLNDISRAVYSFWKAVISDTDHLAKKICDTPVTMDEWRKQHDIQRHINDHSDLEVGFSTFFLNRTNRSGIITGGGAIGGLSQQGEWTIDARYYKTELMRRIGMVARYANRIKLYNLDAEDFIRSVVSQLPTDTLIYLDPPYYVQGCRLYENHYSQMDHVRLAKFVQRDIRQPWIVSYDNHPAIRRLYRDRRKLTYSLQYTAAQRKSGREVMLFSDKLLIPRGCPV